MKNFFISQKGFSMIEFLSVMAIIILLTGFITFNLTRTQQHTSTNTTIDALVTDIKQQQLKAMIQDTQGSGVVDTYGIYFQPTKYTLFKGAAYLSSDPTNFAVDLDTNLQFMTITFPNASIIFAKGSGEVSNFATGQNTIQIKNTASNEIKTITINKYGAVTSIN
jgi:prepilin-type N-terminal cleavage/methylation domain-containing protein